MRATAECRRTRIALLHVELGRTNDDCVAAAGAVVHPIFRSNDHEKLMSEQRRQCGEHGDGVSEDGDQVGTGLEMD